MDELRFKVQGSMDEPYEIIITRRSETNISASCTCAAAGNWMSCKHRIGILSGITVGIVSKNKPDVAIVQSWMKGTDIEAAIETLRFLEAEEIRIKKALSSAKKAIAVAMRD